MNLGPKKFLTLLKELITLEPPTVPSLPPFPASNFNSKSEGGLFISDELAEDISVSEMTGLEQLTAKSKLNAQIHSYYEWEKAQTAFMFTGPDADKALEGMKKLVDKALFKQQEDVWKAINLNVPPIVAFDVTKDQIDDKIYPGKIWDSPVFVLKSYISEEYFEADVPILHPDFRKCPAGEYVVEVISMDYKRSTKENPMVIAEMEIVEDGPHRGVTLKAYFVVRESGLVGWDKFLDACGFDDVKPEDDFNIKTCIGSRLRVYVNDEGWIRAYFKENDA